MSGPSKTPWKVVPGTTSGCAIIAELEPKVRRNVASVGGQVREANARRIVASVNATAGISVEALEAGVVGELVEALEGLIDDEPCRYDHHGYCQTHFITEPCEMAVARAALTKIKGEA